MSMSELLFSFSGRLNRKPWWLVGLATAVVMILVMLVVFIAAGVAAEGKSLDSFSSLGWPLAILIVLFIPAIWVGLAIGAKRLHDRNKSAWWLVVFYVIPGVIDGIGSFAGSASIVFSIASFAISIWGLVELGFLRGTVGPNQYGPDPLEAKV